MYRGNKKFARRMRRLHNEAKDKPRPWWAEDDYVWAPSHVETARRRVQWKRQMQKSGRRDFTKAAKPWRYRRHHRERKPYVRPVKT